MTAPAPPAQRKDVIAIGAFRLIASQRRLTRDGTEVALSGRAFDILVALIARAAEVVDKRDLMRLVWPGMVVEEVTLRFHIANLRKALGDGTDGSRYITTVPGRGYCFVGPISGDGEESRSREGLAPGYLQADLPGRPTRMIDREDDLRKVLAALDAERFVTIVGTGGVGKTTLAVVVAHQLRDAFDGAVFFVDFSMLSDPGLVVAVLASMLGLPVQSHDATPALLAHLRDKRLFLIFDTCEHVIEAVAALASAIFRSASQVHILATSRETLQVLGENVYRLEPLECPPDDESLTAELALSFPAIQLFLDRASANGAHLDFGDAEAALVGGMCRKLDGVALAIELTARRVEAYGVYQTAALLDQRLTLLWAGLRGAPPRQKTLQATMDWSYRLLTEPEREVLRRLAVFVGIFSIEAALAVATCSKIARALVLIAVDSLVAKSMVATRPAGSRMSYQLLDTTRAYVRKDSVSDPDFHDVAIRHATHYRQWLEHSGIAWPTLATAPERAPHLAALNNVRAALEWCFGTDGEVRVGVRLAAAAAPIFWAMSLLPECHRWSQLAILSLEEADRGGPEEMHLQAGLGTSLMNIQGKTDAVQTALNRSLAIAEKLGDDFVQMGLLGILHVLYVRTGDFKGALRYAEHGAEVAARTTDQTAGALARCMLGRALLLRGDVAEAREELEAAVSQQSRPFSVSKIYLAADRHYRPGIQLARALWLQGYPVRAVERVHATLKEVEAHPVALSGALTWAVGLFFWTGDLPSAEMHLEWFSSHAEAHSLGPNAAVARGLKAQLAICRGNATVGVKDLVDCLQKIRAARHGLLLTEFNISLVQGLAATGRFDEAIALIDETIQMVGIKGDTVHLPELLRLKGRLLLSQPQHDVDTAESLFEQSLDLSRKRGARAWELRTAIDLATLRAGQGQSDRGLSLLQPVFEWFTEGFDTVDLIAAKKLLFALKRARSS